MSHSKNTRYLEDMDTTTARASMVAARRAERQACERVHATGLPCHKATRMRKAAAYYAAERAFREAERKAGRERTGNDSGWLDCSSPSTRVFKRRIGSLELSIAMTHCGWCGNSTRGRVQDVSLSGFQTAEEAAREIERASGAHHMSLKGGGK